MKKLLLHITALLACLNVWGGLALADGPALSAQPNVRPSAESSTAGGSASANGGSVGPANVSSSQPVGASTSNTAGSSTQPGSTTTATGPGTTATAPMNAWTAQPDPSVDGATPTPTTSGPAADADASRSTVSMDNSRLRVNAIAIGRSAFAGSLSGVGGAEDPTFLSTCSTAEASPGVPTDVSLGTSCGTGSSTASEDFLANQSDGNAAAGNPSASTCLGANASAGTSPTASLDETCAAGTGTGPVTNPNPGANTGASGTNSVENGSQALGRAGSNGFMSVLGIDSLPSTATAAGASASALGVALIVAGLLLLRRQRTAKLPIAEMTQFADNVGRIHGIAPVQSSVRRAGRDVRVTRAFSSERFARPRRSEVA